MSDARPYNLNYEKRFFDNLKMPPRFPGAASLIKD